jgi:hypothetical protein
VALLRPRLVRLASGAGEPAREVAFDAARLGAAAAVGDVAVGSYQVLRCAVDAEPRERLPVDELGVNSRGELGSSRTTQPEREP